MSTTDPSEATLIGPPFPAEEYARRQQLVLAEMADRGIDALIVTAYGHLQYLTGYDGRGGYFAPFPFILAPGVPPTFVVREFEIGAVTAESCVTEIRGYRELRDFAPAVAEVMRQHGLHDQTVGFELGCWNLAPADLHALQSEMPGMEVVDATRLVATMTAVKTDLELATMREAMAMTDVAVETFWHSLRPGVTELALMEAIEAEVATRTGGAMYQAVNTLVFGERTKLAHGAPAGNAIQIDQPAMFEGGGIKNNYAAGIVRSAVLGRHAETEELHAVAEEAIAATVAAIRPGATAGEVDAAGRAVIERSKFPDSMRHRVGYHTGINWLERGNISIEPGAEDVLRTGMTLHMPFILEGPSGYLFGTSQHVVVTENGADPLSATAPVLHRL